MNKSMVPPNQQRLADQFRDRLPEGELVGYDEYGIPQVPDSAPELAPGASDFQLPPQTPAEAAAARAAAIKARQEGKRGFMPPAAGPAASEVRKAPSAPKKYVHPVVQKLMQKFSLTQAKKHELVIYPLEDPSSPLTLQMTALPDEVSMWCIQQGQDRLRLEGLQISTAWMQVLLSCCSVVSMDSVPIYEALGVQLTPKESDVLASDPLNLPSRVRQQSGLALATLIHSDMPLVGDRLFKFYQEVVSRPSLKSSYDKENEGKVKFVCPVDGCSFEMLDRTRQDEDGKDLPYFCQYHGAPMVQVASFEEENNYPLA